MAEETQLAFYMCLKDGGPLCEGDAPMVFEDIVDADAVLHEVGDEEGIVAEVELETIALRLRDAHIKQVFYTPTAEPGFVMDLDTFAGK
ncbi:MAG: hypothetical protein M3R38_11795 [Actinomycetota bacterium]|nr:hypothetical protein [Actinomycetota bacterium]